MTSPRAPDELSGLQARMRSCRKCLEAGHDIVPKAIFSGGRQAQIMIIGQAPGVTEVEAGRPFNAGSGSRLFDWLGRIGLDEAEFREEQYMTSVTKCFPGKASGGSGDRVPSRAERDLCRPFLDAEIRLVDPRVIVPVGRLAINLFYPSRAPLSEIIGTQKRWVNRWVVPLPHPSGASRWHQIAANRERIQRALQRLKAILEER
jgi:uracil-DNA glycosylase family 4